MSLSAQIEFPFTAPRQARNKKAAPSDLVRQTLTAALPRGVPPSFIAILSSHVEGKGKARQIFADLMMVDGTVATVRLSQWAFGWSHQWMKMPGGPLSWEHGAWINVEDSRP